MKYSFVVPIYNDGALARDFCAEMKKTFVPYLGKDDVTGDLEVIFVDDGSANDSVALVKKACDEFPFAKLIAFSRNFGQHIAISAGFKHARGELVGMMNVDQEDPPSELPKLIEALAEGDEDIAGGLYEEQRKVPLFTRLTSRLFHVFLDRLTGYGQPLNASTVRIFRRRALDVYNALGESSRYIPGLEGWLGFRYKRVPVKYQKRKAGRSSYNFRRRLRMAIASIISFSDFPLRLTVKFGMLIAAAGVLLVFIMILDKLFFRDVLPGYVSTLATIIFVGGVQIMVTGVASLYVGRILAEVQRRPLFVVRETYGDVASAKTDVRP